MKPRLSYLLPLLVMSLTLSGMLTACIQESVDSGSGPVLVTLPVGTLEPTSTATPAPVTPTNPPQPTPTIYSVIQTAVPAQGIKGIRQLWQWSEIARPSALAPTSTRLATIIADGRFAWVDATTGQVETSRFLWTGILEGQSWGEVYTDGVLAVVAARESSINSETGLANSRSRLVIYDAGANELWSLPQLESQHFYSTTMTTGAVIVGQWPYGFEDNSLAAYELLTGELLWKLSEGPTGYRQIVQDGPRVIALLNSSEGAAVASYDSSSGEELWRWADETVILPDLIIMGQQQIYVISVNQIISLDNLTGQVRWRRSFESAPEAGIAVQNNMLYAAPAPTVELGFRPGVIGIDANGGQQAWHMLIGTVADPLDANNDALWVVAKDYDEGMVVLSGLDLQSGLEHTRLKIGTQPDILYQIIVHERRVYILGDTLRAYGY